MSFFQQNSWLYWGKKVTAFLLYIFLASFLFHGQALATKAETAYPPQYSDNWQDLFNQQISTWIKEIGQQVPSFATWLDAKWEVYPLAPGSKQWLIIVKNLEREVGYLIVGQAGDEAEWLLIEYATLDGNLFSNLLESNPDFLHEEFIYTGLLLGTKKQGLVVDLLTSEVYDHVLDQEIFSAIHGEKVQSFLNEQHITPLPEGGAPIVSYGSGITEAITNINDEESFYYQARILPDVTGLYSIETIHFWQCLDPKSSAPTLFIGLQDEGRRFLSYHYLNHIGVFAKWQ